MLKICSPTILKLFGKTFKHCLDTGLFPSEWEKGNIVPIHKRGDEQNSRPVSLLLIWGKIFEQLVFIEMFNFF